MTFTATELPGVWIIDIERYADERGFFARAWCQKEFAAHGISCTLAQANLAHNARRGTLRGMHYNAAPHEEAKLVRIVRGAAYAVVLDWRTSSVTYRRSIHTELSADNNRAIWVPEGCALGYQTLEDDTDVFYLMSRQFVPDAARGMRYDDPALGLSWPLAVEVISEKDRLWPTCAV